MLYFEPLRRIPSDPADGPTLGRPSHFVRSSWDAPIRRRRLAPRVAVVTSFLIILHVALAAQTADRRKTEASADEATERMKGLRNEADYLVLRTRELVDELQRLDAERQESAAALDRNTLELEDTTRQLEESGHRIAALEEIVDA